MTPEVTDSQTLLEVADLAPKLPHIKIGSEKYEMHLASEFSAREYADFTRQVNDFDALWNQPKRSPADGKRMTKLLDDLLNRVMVDAKALRDKYGDKLTDYWKREVVFTFQRAPLLMQAMAPDESSEDAEAETETETTTSEATTPGSSSTTES